MTVIFIAGAAAGIFLGLRFKVFVLVPATLLATLLTIVGRREILQDHGLIAITITVFGTVMSLQIGYIVGGVLRVAAPSRLLERKTVGQPPSSQSRRIKCCRLA